ncbi:hypothetical protein ANANG_G00085150 [Anguilla anguilla]|uniref:CUB domain-containing protein n=1 Tax=Anguilla anguilla TaxID=7936 RepID=A0A9D3S5B3_ANGAN|nr:hypothetical protein ANANG_G00085150 [Anguilla anguilla]
MKALPNDRTCEVYSVSNFRLCPRDSLPTQTEIIEPSQSLAGGKEVGKKLCAPSFNGRKWAVSVLLLAVAITLILFLFASPPYAVFYLGGSVEFRNQSFSPELTDPTSPQFQLQVEALSPYVFVTGAWQGTMRQHSLASSPRTCAFQAGGEKLCGAEAEEELALNKNIFSRLYESSPWHSHYLHSRIIAFSEGVDGLRVFYWSKFLAPTGVGLEVHNTGANHLQRVLDATNKLLFSRNELYSLEKNNDTLPVLMGLDSEDDNSDEKMDKIKNPTSLQSIKWQLGFQAMSFDLYAKYGNNRTLSLVSPKKPYYQWRLRVPAGHVVRLVVLTLHGATPGSCSAHKLSAYDFLLPLQNKIIARWCGLPVSGPSPVMKLISSGNVMLVTFSFNRQRDGAMFKAYFQAVPKTGCGGSLLAWNGTVTSPYYPSHYPPNVDCSWTIRVSQTYCPLTARKFWSDSGLNFVGAKPALKELRINRFLNQLNKSELEEEAAKHGTEWSWKIHPADSPHRNGATEAAI